jgi:hypothetical protein
MMFLSRAGDETLGCCSEGVTLARRSHMQASSMITLQMTAQRREETCAAETFKKRKERKGTNRSALHMCTQTTGVMVRGRALANG